MSSQRLLSYQKDFTPLLKLALPIVITGAIQSSVGFFETIFLAHLGKQTLAAGALVSTLFFTLIVLLFGTFNAINVLIAHKYGAKDQRGISLVLRDGLLLAIILFLPTFFIFWHIASIFWWFGQKQELISLANAYLHGLAWGLFPKFILIVLYDFIIGLGHTRLNMIFTMFSIPLYLFFSYVLIFGQFGFPNLGIAGAGWGMTIGDWITAFILCAYLILNKQYQPYIRDLFTFEKPYYYWEILQLGIPMGLMFCIEVAFFFAMTVLMGTINIQTLAANQIAMQYLGPIMGTIFWIAQAITVRMGHQIGANQRIDAEYTGFAGIILSVIFTLIIAVVYWVFPENLIGIDLNIHDANNVETIHIAKQFFYISAVFQIIESIRIALFGTLRGYKDTRFSLLISTISFWGISLPIGYVLAFPLNLSGNGFWLGMVIGASFSVLLLSLRFRWQVKHL